MGGYNNNDRQTENAKFEASPNLRFAESGTKKNYSENVFDFSND